MRCFRVAAALALLTVFLALIPVDAPPLKRHAPSSVAVYDSNGELLRLTLASDERYRVWTPLEEIDPRLVDAVLLHEDAWFRWHPGVNPVSLVRAAISTYGGGPRLGASTLTMQLARLLERLDTRSVPGKLQQIAAALWLEWRYSKDEILEAYLNLAPYGGNIEGVGAASLIYFDQRPSRLNLPQILTLAVLPQAPSRRGKTADAAINADLAAARGRLFARFAINYRSGSDDAALMALPLPMRSVRQLPFAAPHFVERALADRVRRGDVSTSITTSLDLTLQARIEERIADTLTRAKARGLNNAAAMLLDTRDMGVRALVGSADFFNAAIAGQVNGTGAKRSPGSTLKPFIYALAIDQGVLHPASILRDVPSAFGPFSPENFDGTFLGPITARDALTRSRNVPAVAVAGQLRAPDFYEFLRQSDISQLASAQHYGLALALGGGEVTMEELARLYALLSADGKLRALNFGIGPASAGRQLVSAEAAFIVRDILANAPRPDHATHRGVAWKTGTSWGFRDAWTAGIAGPYVLIVWLGHFDGKSNPALIGVEAAAPLFFSIVDSLSASGVDLSEPPRRWPLNVTRIEVCSASGELPNVHCPQRSSTWFIPGVSPIRISTVHRQVGFDAENNVTCDAGLAKRYEIFEFWPSELRRVYQLAGLPKRLPPSGADCTMASRAPTITSPLRATTYRVTLGSDALTLRADADATAQRLFWFDGGNFLGTTAPGESLPWTPRRDGEFLLRVVDDHGSSAERRISIERR